MYDFSQIKDGTECGLLRNVNPDMADACDKYFTSGAQQQASTVDHQHRKEYTTRYKPYTSTGNKQRTHPAHMYDFSQMKDGTECGLLRNVNPDMADACEKYFTFGAQQQASTVDHHHRKDYTSRYKPYTSTGNKQRTHPAHMYDFSQMKDGTECGLLRNVNPDIADACEKYFTSVAQQRTSTVGRQHRMTVAPKLPATTPHHRRTPPSAQNDSVPMTVATSATGAGVSLPNHNPTAQHLEWMTGINGWKPGCLPDANPNACLDCPNDKIRHECAHINANMANNKPLNAPILP